MNKEKKVVVFGGAGFLGSYVADELTTKGYNVTIFDINLEPSCFGFTTTVGG